MVDSDIGSTITSQVSQNDLNGGGVVTVDAGTGSGANYDKNTAVDATNAVNTFGIYEAIRDAINGTVKVNKIFVRKGAYNFGTTVNGCLIPILNANGLEIEFDPDAVMTFNSAAGGGVFIRYAGCNNLHIHGGQWVYNGSNATVGGISGVGGNTNIKIHDMTFKGLTKYCVSEKGGATNGEGGPVICPGAQVFPNSAPDPTQVATTSFPTDNVRIWNIKGTNIGVAGGDGALVMITNTGQPALFTPSVNWGQSGAGTGINANTGNVNVFTTGAADAKYYVKCTVVPHAVGSWGQTNGNPVTLTFNYTDPQNVGQSLSVQLAANDQQGRCDAGLIAIKGGTTPTASLASASWNGATTKVDGQIEVYNPMTNIFVNDVAADTNFFVVDAGNSQASNAGTSNAGVGPTALVGGFRTVRLDNVSGFCLDNNPGTAGHNTLGILLEDQTSHEDIIITNPSFNGFKQGIRLTGRAIAVHGGTIKYTFTDGIKIEPTTGVTFPHHDSRHIKVQGVDISSVSSHNAATNGAVSVVSNSNGSVSFVDVDGCDMYNMPSTSPNVFLDFSALVYPSTNWQIHGGNIQQGSGNVFLGYATAVIGTALTGAISGVNMPTGANGIYIFNVGGAAIGGKVQNQVPNVNLLGLMNLPLNAAGAGPVGLFGTLASAAAQWTTTVTKTVSGSKLRFWVTAGTVSNFVVADSAGAAIFTNAAASTKEGIILNVGDQITMAYTVYPTTFNFAYAD